MRRTKRIYLGDGVYHDVMAMDEAPKPTSALYDAVNRVSAFHATSTDALTDARRFLYGPGGADEEAPELEDSDREALIGIAQRGLVLHSQLLEALGVGASSRDEAEKDNPRGLQSPGSGASTSSDAAMAHDASALGDVEAIFQPLPIADDGAPEAAANDAGASPWG